MFYELNDKPGGRSGNKLISGYKEHQK